MKAPCPFVWLSALVASCVTYPRLQYFDSWRISSRDTTPSESGRFARTGHLLVSGEASVLLVERHENHDVTVVDDETCHTVRVELPRHPKVGSVWGPVAFHNTCPCVLGECRDEPLVRGRVDVLRVDESSVEARLDLEFPSLRLTKAARFSKATPNEWDIEPPQGPATAPSSANGRSSRLLVRLPNPPLQSDGRVGRYAPFPARR